MSPTQPTSPRLQKQSQALQAVGGSLDPSLLVELALVKLRGIHMDFMVVTPSLEIPEKKAITTSLTGLMTIDDHPPIRL